MPDGYENAFFTRLQELNKKHSDAYMALADMNREELTRLQRELNFFRHQFPTAAKNYADAEAKERAALGEQ